MTAEQEFAETFVEMPYSNKEKAKRNLAQFIIDFARIKCKEQREAFGNQYAAKCQQGTYTEPNHAQIDVTPLVI